ncbi:GtrA family protein [Bacillus salitolerans]|uniref:GtrA family protein n=1 Tax=Bacillus salitolerans TaxID=1437434 RepID=A0ABW4LRE1_9BACI
MLVRNSLVNKFMRYSLVGILCTSIYFLSMFIFVELLNIKPLLGSCISFVLMTIFSYVLNKSYTFGGSYSHAQFVKFITVATIGFFMNFGIMYLIISVLSLHYFIGELVTVIVIPLVNFFLNNYWTFSDKSK